MSDMSARAALAERLEMLLAKATPGPWSNGARNGEDAHMCRIVAKREGGAIVLAQTWNPDVIVSYVGLSREECYYNAELIAALRNAAPELLALLRAPAAGEESARCEAVYRQGRIAARCDLLTGHTENHKADRAEEHGAAFMWPHEASSPSPPEATDLAEQLQISKIGHEATLQALGDVKRELAHYKAGEQPRVEDRDREIAELKQQIKATERPATPAGTAERVLIRLRDWLEHQRNLGPDERVVESPMVIVQFLDDAMEQRAQADSPAPPVAPRGQTCETCRFLQRPSVDLPKVWWCGHAKSPLGTRHFTREKIVQLSCIFHVPAAPAPASTEEK